MADYLRDLFGLTQERLASWLGVSRGTLAMSEGSSGRGMPGAIWQNNLRLIWAAQGKVFDPATPGVQAPAPPPLPAPPEAAQPLARRLDTARHEARLLTRRLALMRGRAAQFEARLAALPALRAYAGPVANTAREAGWLALFEGEALDALRDHCGAGPQRLLAARLAGLAQEIALLEASPQAPPQAPPQGPPGPGGG